MGGEGGPGGQQGEEGLLERQGGEMLVVEGQIGLKSRQGGEVLGGKRGLEGQGLET